MATGFGCAAHLFCKMVVKGDSGSHDALAKHFFIDASMLPGQRAGQSHLMCIYFENSFLAYCVRTDLEGEIPVRNTYEKSWCQIGNSSGFVDNLGRPFKMQQERSDCMPVRDVSRLNLATDKTDSIREVTRKVAKNGRGVSEFLCATARPARTRRTLLPEVAVQTNVNEP